MTARHSAKALVVFPANARPSSAKAQVVIPARSSFRPARYSGTFVIPAKAGTQNP
jgi:hypothetical protein